MKRLVLCVLLVACNPPEYPPAPTDGAPCVRACKRIEQLDCPEAVPEPGEDGQWGTNDDVPCVVWMCRGDYLDYEKIANATSCEVLR